MFTAAKIAVARVAAVAVPGLAASMLVLAPAAQHAAAAAVAGHAAIAPSGADTAARHLSGPTQLSRAASALSSSSFPIINAHSFLCLGITGGRNDAPAVQWTCNGHLDQAWHWGSENNIVSGQWQLVNGDGECLGVANGSFAQGARVVGWTCLGPKHFDQYWSPITGLPTGFCGSYMPLLSGTVEVLGVASNSTSPGAAVVQWTDNEVPCDNQNWSFPLPPSS